jgi:protein gp37
MEDRLQQPQEVRKPGRVFVCSMSDFGHETVGEHWRQRIYTAMQYAPWHTYIILTKRPGAWMREIPVDPVKCWVGVTIENQEQAEKRLPSLLQTDPRLIRFVSVEPMLAPVDLRAVMFPTGNAENVLNTEVSERAKPIIGKLNGIDWVIAGPETGPKKRPFSDWWIDDAHRIQGLHEQCKRECIPFFDKREKWTSREWPK